MPDSSCADSSAVTRVEEKREKGKKVQGWSNGVGLLVEGTSLSLVAQAPFQQAPSRSAEFARQKYLYLDRTVPSMAYIRTSGSGLGCRAAAVSHG